jgi:hypothetical protein
LLMPLNKATARKARRQEFSAAASSELAGCGRGGRGGWVIKEAVSPIQGVISRTGRIFGRCQMAKTATWLRGHVRHDRPDDSGKFMILMDFFGSPAPRQRRGGPDILPNQIKESRRRHAGKRTRCVNRQATHHRAGAVDSPARSKIKNFVAENQERASSDRPMLNAFCRVAPSVLRNRLAILPAAVFFFASVFNSRTSVAVQARRFFDFLAINPPFQERQSISLSGGGRNSSMALR